MPVGLRVALVVLLLLSAGCFDKGKPPEDAPPMGCTSTSDCAAFPVTACHVAVCNVTSGLCESSNASDGAACDDGSKCSTGDTCVAGACTAGTATACGAPDQCHVAGTCDPATGLCSNPNKPDGTTCDDGSMCTTGDTCQAGACTGGTATACTASDQCHVAGVCNPSTGVCSDPAAPDSTPCTDGSMCTTGDTCQTGVCAPGTPTTCTASDQCHEAGVCNPGTGVCSDPAAPDTTPCSDGSMCTTGDACQTGVCMGGTATTCTASDQCHTAGVCNPGTGQCSNPAAPDTTPCTDGSLCTTGDVCQTGVCIGGTATTCTQSDQCHSIGVCNPGTGQCSNPAVPDTTPCSDGSLCTTGDVCQTGACVSGTATTCTASDQCHAAGTCNPANGVCSNPIRPNNTPCTDANLCLNGDTCQGGVCSSGATPIVCTQLDQCHVVGVCDPGTGVCSDPAADDGDPCSDGSLCTTGDSCQTGACVAGPLTVHCPSPGKCQVATCAPATGTCVTSDKPNGTACSDGVLCTVNDTCLSGTCSAGPGLCTSIVISQFRTLGPNGGNDEFVELHNNTDAPIDISTHVLRGSTATGTVSNRVTLPANTTLPARGYFLFTNNNASSSYSGTVPGNATYGTGIADGGGILFTTPTFTVLDAAGMSAAAVHEGTPLAPLTTNINASYQRKPNGSIFGAWLDTNDNANDFTLINPSLPHNASMSPQILATNDLYFGNVVNQSMALTVTITNLTAAPITLSTLVLSGPNAAEFSVGVPASMVIAANGTTTVSVTFTPTTVGGKRALLEISTTNAITEPAPVDLFAHAAP